MTDTSSSATNRNPRWPWVVLGLGLVWTILLRVPLIVNAEDHLDSDLAVDGLTLIDAVHGQWRWHYPGTPHMGILPLFFSYPQAMIWGANAFTLVSGGTLIWLLIVTGTFALAWKTYGPSVAGWAIIPLVFSSTGTIWLSGRITGGHLLTLAWHTLAFVGLHGCLSKGGAARAIALGFWCGLGLYLDMMFLFTLFGLVPAAIVGWFFGGRWRLRLGTIASFVLATLVGFLPHEIGRSVDPHDAYPSQFVATFDGQAIHEHGRLLALACLPRLIAGTELDEFERAAVREQSIVVNVLAALIDGRRSRRYAAAARMACIPVPGRILRRKSATRTRSDLDGRPCAKGDQRGDVAFGALDRDRLSRQSEHFQLGQLPILDFPAHAVVDGFWTDVARFDHAKLVRPRDRGCSGGDVDLVDDRDNGRLVPRPVGLLEERVAGDSRSSDGVVRSPGNRPARALARRLCGLNRRDSRLR